MWQNCVKQTWCRVRVPLASRGTVRRAEPCVTCRPVVQVFRVDTTTTEASLIAHRPQPVLALQPDTYRDVLWVSTANSSVHAWPLGPPDARADPPVSPPKPRAHEPPTRPDATESLARVQSGAHASVAPGLQAPPVFTISGHAPLVRCAVFDDRRHVLTRDMEGRVGLWDVVRGKHVKHYEAGAVRSQPFVHALCTDVPAVTSSGPMRGRTASVRCMLISMHWHR